MKLRLKKSGKIYRLSEDIYIEYTQGGKIKVRMPLNDGNMSFFYDSLAGLTKDWEDVEGPLIKDESDPERAEKIRKAVRTWAEVLHIDQDNIKVSIGSHRTSIIGWQPGLIGGYSIDFPNILNELHDGMQTTVTELCGDEEE